MKKILFAAALLSASSFVFAAGIAAGLTATKGEVCDGKAGSGMTKVNGGSGTVIEASKALFTKNGFDVQCSSNTFVSFEEVSANLAAVAAGSAKGNQSFGGHSNGGSILPGGAAGKEADAKCTGTNDACIADDVTKTLGNAVTAGKGS